MINIGQVSTFADVIDDKKQALKVVEEAAEVFGEWQNYDNAQCYDSEDTTKLKLLSECADVIQATCNLLAALGIHDFTEYMEECKVRNEYRGRAYEDTVVKIPVVPAEQMELI